MTIQIRVHKSADRSMRQRLAELPIPIAGCSTDEDRICNPDEGVEQPDDQPMFDGIDLRVNEDEFPNSDDDEVVILPKGKKSTEPEEIPPEVIEQLKANPALQAYFSDMVETSVEAKLKEHERQQSQSRKRQPDKRPGKSPMRGHENINDQRINVQKSPSDTTIYQPALAKGHMETNEVINKISNFVEHIRIGSSKRPTPVHEPRRKEKERGCPNTLNIRSSGGRLYYTGRRSTEGTIAVT